ncbi:MAG: hypothetical protein JRC88_09230 [Deltaproteobacteria bacterium]|nr:hypothetical protein [Deltaproteobacteria bacterium]
MKWFLYAISLIWISIGCCFILYTNETKNIIRSLIKTIDHKIISFLPFIFGVLFLFAASASRNPWLIRLIGFMGITKGLFIFINPKGFYDKLSDWYLNSLSDQTHRFYGIFAIILGTAVLSWIL